MLKSFLPIACLIVAAGLSASELQTLRFGADYVSPSIAPIRAQLSLRDLPAQAQWRPGDAIREFPKQFFPPDDPQPVPINQPNSKQDPLALRQRSMVSPSASATLTRSFDALSNASIRPMDPVLDVSNEHVVVAINGAVVNANGFQVYDKTGAPLAPPVSFAALAGNSCASVSDPFVLFDQMAQRWLFLEIGSLNRLCVYISSSANPLTSTWLLYPFTFGATPDYPQIGIWHNSYVLGLNEGSVAGTRPLVVFDRAKMIAGQPATFQRFNVPRLAGFSFQLVPPVDFVGGTAPPTNAPAMFVRHRDDEAHNASANNPSLDFLELWQLSADWTTPANSVLSGPASIPISEFSSDLNGFNTLAAFAQPNGVLLDPVREMPMRRISYRNFGNYESIVGNFVTDVDGLDTGGIRWFELRRTTPGGAFALHQEGTYAPDSSNPADRWMATIAQDESGHMALAYAITRDAAGGAIFPSLRFTGRLATDPPGVMTQAETTIVAGSASQATSTRWGDYFDMVTDPVDECAFWFVGSYVPQADAPKTRVASLRFPECGVPRHVLNTTTSQASVCVANGARALAPVPLNLSVLYGFTGIANLSFAALPSGFSGSFSNAAVSLPGVSQAHLHVSPSASPGSQTVTITSIAGAQTQSVAVHVNVATLAATAATLQTPINNANSVATHPTFSWTPVPQVADYTLQLSTDPAFTTIVSQQTISNATTTASIGLNSNTEYFWRVLSSNICPIQNAAIQFKDGFENDEPGVAMSSVFRFTTAPEIGDCSSGTTTNVVFSESMDTGAPNWTVANSTGSMNWSISNAYAFSPANAYRTVATPSVGDVRLITPSIAIPNAGATRLLFQNKPGMEPRLAGGCWDAGVLEISTNGGANFTPISTGISGLNYHGEIAIGANPAGGLMGWCGGLNSAYQRTAVDLTPYAGQNVRLSFRATADSINSIAEGWNVDDVRVLNCQ